MAKYNLGSVKAHVAAAADHFGSAHNIGNIGGWRAKGSVPGSDHPKGLALDFMTSSKSRGDALANDLITNAKAWNVKYVIWWRQIWQPGKGWSAYSGPSPHTDHVHASFGDKAGSGLGSIPGRIADAVVPDGISGAVKHVGDQLQSIAGTVASVGKVADALTLLFLPNNIIRGVAGMAGTLFVLIGIWFLSREIRE